MNVMINAVHFDMEETNSDYISKKLPRLDFAKNLIVDFILNVIKESKNYELETTINFKWGKSIHIHVSCYDIDNGIDQLFDKMEYRVSKEKKKVQEHKGSASLKISEASEI